MEKIKFNDYEIQLTKKQNAGLVMLGNPKKTFIKFWGGARSGKTFLIVLAIFVRAIKYNGSRHLIARYALTTAKKTVWRQTVLPIAKAFQKMGLCKINYSESFIEFKNDSMIILGGLRPTDIANVLSSEYETVFICEANENTWAVIEDLQTRLQGKSKDNAGNYIALKFIVDMNPTVTAHWSNTAWLKGVNPSDKKPIKNYHLYDNLHWIPQDNRANLNPGYIALLEALSTGKRNRFFLGQYGTYEGLVYSNFNEENIVDDFEIPKDWTQRVLAFDFGYVHAFCALWLVLDPNETIYLYREYVATRRTVRVNALKVKIKSLNDLTDRHQSLNDVYEIVADWDAGDRATLAENGIDTEAAYKEVKSGLDNVIDFVDRKKLKVFRSCVDTISGFSNYLWKETVRGVSKDREPLKENDDEMDALRYAVCKLFPVEEIAGAIGATGLG